MTDMRMIPIKPDKTFSQDTTKAFAAMYDAVKDTVADGVTFMSNYPRQSAGSRYRRTGTLRRSWDFKVKSGGRRIEGIVGSNSNIAPYNRSVQGENQLPHFERIGWHNVKELVGKMSNELPKKVQAALGRAFG